jgi:hypothetical protein
MSKLVSSGCSKYYAERHLAMFGFGIILWDGNDSTFCMVFKMKQRRWSGRIILV